MIVVLIIVAVLLYFFFSTKKEEKDRIKNQGGIYLKYKELFDHFMEIPNIQIEKNNNYSLTLAVKDKMVVTRFTISHGFEDVSVFWNHQSVRFGKHSLSWVFPENLPQSQMINTIEGELEIYQNNILFSDRF